MHQESRCSSALNAAAVMSFGALQEGTNTDVLYSGTHAFPELWWPSQWWHHALALQAVPVPLSHDQ